MLQESAKASGFSIICILYMASFCAAQDSSIKDCWNLNPEIAIKGCSQLIQSLSKNDQNRSTYLDLRGLAYAAKGRSRDAIADYSAAIGLEPEIVTYYVNRGLAYAAIADFRSAFDDLNHAIELKPENPEALYNRGSVYSQHQEYDKAIVDFTHAIALKPNFALAYNDRGGAYHRLGMEDESIADVSEKRISTQRTTRSCHSGLYRVHSYSATLSWRLSESRCGLLRSM
jgi:tetratricopeptide (TPR) repeat protein